MLKKDSKNRSDASRVRQRGMDRKGLEDRLDASLSRIVRLRDKWCVICGSPYNLEAGHIFGRGRQSLRWDPFNVFAICHSCNQRDVRDHAPYRNWFIGKYGQEKFDELERRSYQTADWSIFELQELLKYFRQLERKYEIDL